MPSEADWTTRMDPRKRPSEHHDATERAFCSSEAGKIAERFMDGLLPHGYDLSFLELVAQRVSDEIYRMKGEIRRRNS